MKETVGFAQENHRSKNRGCGIRNTVDNIQKIT